MRRDLVAALFVVAVSAPACIPYTVGTTAQPVTPGKTTTAMMIYPMPSVSLDTSSRSPYGAGGGLQVDGEVRWGLDGYSDVGLRAVGFSGIVGSYKRLITDTSAPVKVAVMPGIGFVNGGMHAYGEFTLLLSGREPPTGLKWEGDKAPFVIVPYGGLRVSQVAPLTENAVHDQPTYGGFLGVRFGTTTFGVSPEIGVFHDHSALGMRRSDVVIIPAVVLHGTELISIFRRLPLTYMRSSPVERRRPNVASPSPDIPILPPILTPPYKPAVAGQTLTPPAFCSGQRPGCTVTRRSPSGLRQRP